MSKTAVYLITCLLFLTQLPAQAHPLLPEYCFESKEDIFFYELFGDAQPSSVDPDREPDAYVARKMRAFIKHGPVKKTSINIVVKETQKNGMIYLDASATTSPNKQPMFAWGDNPTVFRAGDSKISSQAGQPGSTGGILMTVEDSSCRLRTSKFITFIIQP